MPKPIAAVELKFMLDPKLEKRTRRTYTAEYKLSIIQQAGACKYGELGALLRREKLLNMSTSFESTLYNYRASTCLASREGASPKLWSAG